MSYSSSRADHTVDMLLSMMSLLVELVAWHSIYLIRWHIYFDDEFSDEISICLYTIFWGSIQVLRRGIINVILK